MSGWTWRTSRNLVGYSSSYFLCFFIYIFTTQNLVGWVMKWDESCPSSSMKSTIQRMVSINLENNIQTCSFAQHEINHSENDINQLENNIQSYPSASMKSAIRRIASIIWRTILTSPYPSSSRLSFLLFYISTRNDWSHSSSHETVRILQFLLLRLCKVVFI